MALANEHKLDAPGQSAHLRDLCESLWCDNGPDRVRKEVAALLVSKATNQSCELRLHVLGHMLNVQLGKGWKQKYGVDCPMAQFLQHAPFRVVPTDIPNVDAVRLDIQQLLSMHAARNTTGAADSFAAASRVHTVPRPSHLSSNGKVSPKAPSPATSAASSSSTSNGTGTFSPKAGGIKSASVIAYINSMRLHEQQHINMLRQALASHIVRKAAGADGRIAAAQDTQQYRVTALHAGTVIEKAWRGRYPSEPNPHSDLQQLLAGDQLLKLLPAADPATAGSSCNSGSSEQVVQLDMQLLLERVSRKAGSPAAPLTPAAAGPKLVIKPAASPNPAGEVAAAKLMGLLTGKAGKPAAGAVFSRAAAAANGTLTAHAAPGRASNQAVGLPAAVQNTAGRQPPVQHEQEQQHQSALNAAKISKKFLLNFIQRRQWDRNVDYNLMKRAVATFLVNRAAEGEQECSLDPVAIHVAKAGEVFHKVWTGRHGTVDKPYKKVADVLGSDPFLTIQDGPNHARQLVQLDIEAMFAAAGGAAAVAEAVASAAPTTSPESGPQAPAGTSSAAVDAAAEARSPCSALQETPQAVSSASSPATMTALNKPSAHQAPGAGSLLVLDLLAYAGLVTWHASDAGLNLLRRELACMMIEAAHPGLAEAVFVGQQVAASCDSARYAMSPYAAGSALMSIWQAHHPDEPRPYTALPSALESCKYLLLRLSASGYQVQLDLEQLSTDCAKAMVSMAPEWQARVDASTAAVAAKALRSSAASLVTAAAPAGATAAEPTTHVATVVASEPVADISSRSREGSQQVVQHMMPSSPSISGSSNVSASCNSAANAAAAAASRRSSASNGIVASTAFDAAYVPLQPQIPNLQQLLTLLSYAPPGVCQHAAVVWVPELMQQLMFRDHEGPSVRLQSSAGKTEAPSNNTAVPANDGGYEMYGIQKLQDAVAVNRMLDHLLACPILAVGCCTAGVNTAGTPVTSATAVAAAAGKTAGLPAGTVAPRQQQLLLQVLAPPVVGHDSGQALDAAVYVFEVPRLQKPQQQQDGNEGCEQLYLLLSILLEDARVVKLVDGHHMLPLLQQRYGINMAGALDVNMLQSMLGPSTILEDVSFDSCDAGGLEAHLAAYKLTTGQLEGSKNILRSLMERGCSEGKPIPAELVSTAASTVRPLMPLALSMLQLLPVALMRRCMLGALMPAPAAAPPAAPLPAAAAVGQLSTVQPHQQQMSLQPQTGSDLAVGASWQSISAAANGLGQ